MTQALSDAIGGWMFIIGVLLLYGFFIYAMFGIPNYKPPKPKPRIIVPPAYRAKPE